jgi:hypothetical protein
MRALAEEMRDALPRVAHSMFTVGVRFVSLAVCFSLQLID